MQLRRRTDACSEASIGEAAKDTILGIPRLRPMLASTSKEPFDGSDRLFEVKWDGYRCLAYLRGGDVYLDSRNGKPLLSRFQSLSGMKEYLNCTSALLDGEIVAVDGGRVDFSYLRTNPRSVTFVAFDILHLDGRLLVDRPLAERKELLRGAMKWGGPVALSEFVEGQGKAMFEWAREQDLEGIMAKRKDSPYIPGMRTDNWLKVKNTHEGRFWVLGYLASPGRTIGSLVVAEKVEDGYAVLGRVSSGLNRQYEDTLLSELEHVSYEELLGTAGILYGAPSKRELQKVKWVKPYFGVQVDFTELTPDRKLRHPVFRDIVSGECRAH